MDKIIFDILDQIEQKEARFLNWGLVDSFINTDELYNIIDATIEGTNNTDYSVLDHEAIIDELVNRALIFEVSESIIGVEEKVYRSRMAEGVRLFFRLRQQFAKHEGDNGWQTAPTLVSDYRFLWRRRKYPRRDIEPTLFLAELRNISRNIGISEATSVLLSDRGENFLLANFQVRASKRIIQGLEKRKSAGTLVSAGTGSGKTLAFYLPALAMIYSRIIDNDKYWVKVVALYPRVELLKDQFSEIYTEARRLDHILIAQNRRKIRIATLFGSTPYDAEDARKKASEKKGWTEVRGGIACNYIRCSNKNCEGDLIWCDDDLEQKKERLQCDSCSKVIDDDEIILTRDRLKDQPPDILFTTTEMLNQRLSNIEFRHVFGIGSKALNPPELMLLDEVHTYIGTNAAQVAYLIRRWRKLVGKSVNFVGLSATLREGGRFFARLCGLTENLVEEVSPRPSEIISEGAEYFLVLRGDPVSQTALLSTTIQTTMLLSRLMDTRRDKKSKGIYGERIFVFNDDIDVTNRLYFGMLDAEGRTDRGQVNSVRYPRGGLAHLRFPRANSKRKASGQDWEFLKSIGHSLINDRKIVDRVMQLDSGVDNAADIVIATASLEVGFNDPRVGAIIQHKTPKGTAQFLQRKGRAGRSRKMRPWTVVVLSEYGQDRLSYLNFESLFDPELPQQNIPLENIYVRRMQSVFATLDYIGQKLSHIKYLNVWNHLSNPISNNKRFKMTEMINLLESIINDPIETDHLSNYLEDALQLNKGEVSQLLWEFPRPLISVVIPTALRRIRTNWTHFGTPETDYKIKNSPLPEFIPSTLFNDLNLPEVRLQIPTMGPEEERMMPIAQAMKEYAPGNVSRRYGLNFGSEMHWIGPDLDSESQQILEINKFYESEFLGIWKTASKEEPIDIPVYRPLKMKLLTPPKNVKDTSTATLNWRTQIVARNMPLEYEPPIGSDWKNLICHMHVFTHNTQTPIEIRRFATGSSADIKFSNGLNGSKQFSFVSEQVVTAIGFSLQVDGIRFGLKIPENLWLSGLGSNNEKWRSLRIARYNDRASRGDAISNVSNPFLREWLARIFYISLVNEAIKKDALIKDVLDLLKENKLTINFDEVLLSTFQSSTFDDDDTFKQDKLRIEINEHLNRQDVLVELFKLAEILWKPIDSSWETWLISKYTSTVASVLHQSLVNLCPEINSDGLIIDIDPGPREDDDVFLEYGSSAEVWVTEISPGGCGLIEEISRRYSDDPRKFFALITAATQDNELTLIDHQLNNFLTKLVGKDPNTAIQEVVKKYRFSKNQKELQNSLTDLYFLMTKSGFTLFNSFKISLLNRILRSGSNSDTDKFTYKLVNEWEKQENRLGFELDGRVIAYKFSKTSEVDDITSDLGISPPDQNLENWRFNVLFGLLWPRGSLPRQASLKIYNRYYVLPDPEPLMVREYLNLKKVILDITEDDWQTRALEILAIEGVITLTCIIEKAFLIQDALCFFATHPVQNDYLSVYSRLVGVRRIKDDLLIDLEIMEILQ